MSRIPKPGKKIETGTDKTEKYLEEWKKLFNEISPEYLTAYTKKDNGFPKSQYEMEMHVSRLQDSCNTDVQIFVLCKFPNQYGWSYGNEIYLCLHDHAYAIAWVKEFDANLDTLGESGPASCEEMYKMLCRDALEVHNKIPVPIKK